MAAAVTRPADLVGDYRDLPTESLIGLLGIITRSKEAGVVRDGLAILEVLAGRGVDVGALLAPHAG